MSTTPLPRTAGVRNALVSIIAIFSLLIFGAHAMRALEAWGDYADARKAQEFDAGANLYVAGTFVILRERLLTNNALQANETVSAAMRQEIEQARSDVRRSFDAGLLILEV